MEDKLSAGGAVTGTCQGYCLNISTDNPTDSSTSVVPLLLVDSNYIQYEVLLSQMLDSHIPEYRDSLMRHHFWSLTNKVVDFSSSWYHCSCKSAGFSGVLTNYLTDIIRGKYLVLKKKPIKQTRVDWHIL